MRHTAWGVARVLVTILFAFSSYSVAQTTLAEIKGLVTDPTGAVIPGVSITITNVDTGVETAMTTNEVGSFYMRSVLPGVYDIQAEQAGFKSFRASGVAIRTGYVLRYDMELEVGDIATRIEVTAESGAAEVQTDSSDISATIDAQTVRELPKITRKALELMFLSPAMVPILKGGLFDNHAGAAIQFSIAGNPNVRSNMYLLDGVSTTRGHVQGDGGAISDIAPTPETIAEMRIELHNYSAEFGESIGGVIMMTSKAGTNDFRGEAYYWRQDAEFNARSFFSTAELNPSVQWNPGGLFGGPIIKNKTFFFANLEYERVNNFQPEVRSVASLAQRRGDFSGVFNSDGSLIPIYDPATNRTVGGEIVRDQFPNNMIPLDRFDSITNNVLTNFTADPNSAGTITGKENFKGDRNAIDARRLYQFYRVDHQLGQNDRFYMRFARDSGAPDWHGVYVGTRQEIADRNEVLLAQTGYTAATSWTRIVSPRTLSELAIGYNNFPLDRQACGNVPECWQQDWAGRIGLTNLGVDTFPIFSPSGYDQIGSFGGWAQIVHPTMRAFHVTETMSHHVGNHNIRFGGTYKASRAVYALRSAPSGRFDFNRTPTGLPKADFTSGDAIASMLLGMPSFAKVQDTPLVDVRTSYYGLFVQNDWRVKRGLTLNLGVRYEYYTPKINVTEGTNSFDFDTINPVSGTPGVVTFNTNTWSRVENLGHKHTQLTNNPKLQFAPRFGFAWTPSAAGDLVIRGSYGMFFVSGDYGDVFWSHPALGEGVVQTWNADSVTGANAFLVQDGFPVVPGEPLNDAWGSVPFGDLTRTNPNFFWNDRRAGYSQHLYFGIQKKVGRFLVDVAYLGNLTRKLPRAGGAVAYNQTAPQLMAIEREKYLALQEDPNAPANAVPRLLRPFPQFGSVTGHGESRYSSNYNAGYIELRRNFSQGLSFSTSYTFAKHLDNQNGRDFYDIGRDHGPAGLQRRHRFIWSGLYELPFGRGKQFLNSGPAATVLGGWTLSSIVEATSGAPFGIGSNNNRCFCFGQGSQGAQFLGGNPDVSNPTAEKWFNTDAFGFAEPYTWGNVGRGILERPGSWNVDSSIAKRFDFTERYKFEVRADFFNFFNHANLSGPNTSVGSGSFGRITRASNNARRVQIGLRFFF